MDVPEWKALVTVVDEKQQPVVGADVTIGFYVAPPADNPTGIATDAKRGVTDTNGVFTASGRSGSSDLFFGASKAGYYHSHLEHEFARFKNDDPERLSPRITLLLKKIIRPTAMYAKWNNLGMPIFDKSVGFDLSTGDWVAPYGKGPHSDILFNAHLDQRSEKDYDYTLAVSFPNSGDGIQDFVLPAASGAHAGSDLRSAQEAPVEGYQPKWVQMKSLKPGAGYTGNWDANRNYYIRVRTQLDEHGNVISALYGKIYGDFMQFTYYLNPTPNDREIEFDLNRNLLGEPK